VTTLSTWAATWGIPAAAVADLRARLLLDNPDADSGATRSEAGVQADVRLEASRLGMRLWRNNKGALPDARGVPVRFGLANESPAVGKRIRSADLIGIRPVVITPALLGCTIGQFVSREMKRPGWRYNPNDPHEAAQMRWAELVCGMGGDAGFATGKGSL
jgi:hypothetical protein